MEERIQKDIWYLKNWSFMLDLEILLKTVAVTLKGDKNAY
jgi:putative colanic acid biosynthesis UDP-glucose lipid carrier transferase